MTVLLILLAGLFDRMRGSGWFPYAHGVGMVGMGAVLSLLLGLHGSPIVVFILAWCIGAAPGWGNPLGAAFEKRPMGTNYEWWQVGVLRVYTLEALTARGFIWTLPTLLLAPVHPGVLIFVPLAAMAFPISVYVARDIPRSSDYAWTIMEVGRGMMMGLAAYIGGLAS